MAEFSAIYTLTTPGGQIIFNSGVDQYRITNDPAGLDEEEMRVNSDDAAQTDGKIIFDTFGGGHEITIEGVVYIVSEPFMSGYIARRNLMVNNLRTALRSIRRANGTLSWVEQGIGARSLVVRYTAPLQSPSVAEVPEMKAFIFGLGSPQTY